MRRIQSASNSGLDTAILFRPNSWPTRAAGPILHRRNDKLRKLRWVQTIALPVAAID
jgi:hypothetical protein